MKNRIIGSWVLESFNIDDAASSVRAWGKNTTGLLIYSPEGYMSVSINKNVEGNSEQETKNIFDSILFYSGTYTINGGEIHHKVFNASNPSRIGKSMIRYPSLNGDLLTLKSPVESFGQAILVWRKIQP